MNMVNASANSATPTTAPGIRGRVLQMSGDFMPSIASTGAAAGRTQPVQTRVWIFSGKLPATGPEWPVAAAQQHPQLVKQVESNAAGWFAAALPPGEYTLLAQFATALYLNSFAGDGSYTSVQVGPNQVVEFDVVHSAGATF